MGEWIESEIAELPLNMHQLYSAIADSIVPRFMGQRLQDGDAGYIQKGISSSRSAFTSTWGAAAAGALAAF